MNSSEHNLFNKNFGKFEKSVQETVQELTKDVDQEHKLEAEVAEKKKEIIEDQMIIRKDEYEINRLKPEIRHLQQEKIKIAQDIQRFEQQSRDAVNKNISDRSQRIKPLNEHEHRN